MLLTWGQSFSPADSKKQNKLKKAHCGDMIDLLFIFKFTLIKNIESISLLILSYHIYANTAYITTGLKKGSCSCCSEEKSPMVCFPYPKQY